VFYCGQQIGARLAVTHPPVSVCYLYIAWTWYLCK